MIIKGEKRYRRVVELDEGLLTRICDYLGSKFEDVELKAWFDKNKMETFHSCTDLFDFFERNEYQIEIVRISAGKETESNFDVNILIYFFCDDDDRYGAMLQYEYLDDADFIQAVINRINGFIKQNSVWYGFASFLLAWAVSGLILAVLYLLATYLCDTEQIIVVISVGIASLLFWVIGIIWHKKLFPATQFWIRSNIKRQEKLSTLRKAIFGTVIGGTILSIIGNIIWELFS